ncbi:MFS transporter [Pseudomaricurvus alkylphenolicus]|uniref:MFS transporter n=1 Tax=Pseudomaricurvus alkylphenolicus TaxID=1306991 RepID=UPI0014234187|nr:MFS transporter [Pseudomaricurvus alkylphenolicus]NIB40407.1 MFS transporter [Pseudomaricurvus alkylphenolicus]
MTVKTTSAGPNSTAPYAERRELFAWAMYDFANSGYTTVVFTTIFNVYFVGVVAASLPDEGRATFLWTLALGIANGIVLISAPVLGAIADHRAIKKRLLLFTTVGCVGGTALLSLVGPGDIALAMTLVVISSVMFASGENLISAFLPEISSSEQMGRISGFAWGLGYFGGIVSLGACLAYIAWAESQGHGATDFVPVTLLIVAVIFALSAAPTFIWLRERALPSPSQSSSLLTLVVDGWRRVDRTLRETVRFKDLFRFLISLTLFQCGIMTVIVLAAIYATEVIGMSQQQVIILVLVVNVTAALGAVSFGVLQDKIGSVLTLAITLLIWIIAVAVAYNANTVEHMWLTGNLIGLAMGAAQAAGRALVGQFTPPDRTAEFFGLWGLAMKLAAIIGPLSYGTINYLAAGNHRLALLSTLVFFIAGLGVLLTVREQRGKQAVIEPRAEVLENA